MSTGKCDSFGLSDSIMPDVIGAYVNSEKEALKMPSDDEDTTDPTIAEAQEKYNQLQERYVTLKTMTESLKGRISLEKEQWSKELQATVEMEAEMRRRNMHMCGDRCGMNKDEYKRKMELFKDFIFFQNATESLENILRRKNYESWISEVENKCNLELLKIKENMTILKPLQDIASRWSKEDQAERTYINGASGDRPDDTQTAPVKETNQDNDDN